MRPSFIYPMIFFAAIFLAGSAAFATHEKNYYRVPSPSPYVCQGFSGGNLDAMVTAGPALVLTKNDDLFGADAGVKGRYAFDDTIAVEGGTGLAMFGGIMDPGLVPLAGLTGFTAAPDGKGTVFTMAYRLSFNIEIQMYNSSRFGLIFFCGPNFNLFFSNRVSDYTLAPAAGEYTDRQRSVSVIGGAQFGLAFNIPLKNEITLCPIFMIAPFMGTSHIHDNPGGSGIQSSSPRLDVPSATTVTIGMDIKWDRISISPMAQVMQLSSENSSRKDHVFTLGIAAGYHFFTNKM